MDEKQVEVKLCEEGTGGIFILWQFAGVGLVIMHIDDSLSVVLNSR